MINKMIYSYALAKAMYEKEKDYIDTYYTFILKILPIDKVSLDLDCVSEKVEEKFNIIIPEVSLKSIITRAKKSGYLFVEKKQKKWQIKISDKGIKYVGGLETESNVKRKIDELLNDILNYFKDDKLNMQNINKIFFSVIDKNIELLREYFSPHSRPLTNKYIKKKSGYEKKLFKYIKLAENQKPRYWEMLRNIVYGSIITTAAFSKNISVLDKKFKYVQIFLDSNFIFSLFDLHYPEINKATKELFSLLKSYKFKLKVFDFTLDEMINVLSNYARKQNIYYKDIKVNSIFSNLKTKGYTIEDMKEFIRKIENKLWDLNIEIVPTTIDLDKYIPDESQISKIMQYKPKFGNITNIYNHDLAAIEKIKEIRKTKVREIEKSKAIFLSSDLKLAKYNHIEMGHRKNLTIGEVIPGRLLTNILWLKNPTIKEDIPMDTIISVYSGESMITREIWERFCENIEKLKKEGRIQDIDIATLLFDKQMEDILTNLDDSDIDDFTPDETFKNINKIKLDLQQKIEVEKKEYEEKLSENVVKIEKMMEHWESIRLKLDKKAKINAKKYSYIIITIPLLFLILILTAQKTPVFFQTISAALWILYLVLRIYFKIDLFNVQSKLYTRLYNYFYRKYIGDYEFYTPLDILKKRYAIGDINKKEYLEKKKELEK